MGETMGRIRRASDTVAVLGDQLASHVGGRVRLHLLNGQRAEGVLVDAPLVYRALNDGNALVLKGRVVLRSVDDASRSDVFNLEEIQTYDVLSVRSDA